MDFISFKKEKPITLIYLYTHFILENNDHKYINHSHLNYYLHYFVFL